MIKFVKKLFGIRDKNKDAPTGFSESIADKKGSDGALESADDVDTFVKQYLAESNLNRKILDADNQMSDLGEPSADRLDLIVKFIVMGSSDQITQSLNILSTHADKGQAIKPLMQYFNEKITFKNSNDDKKSLEYSNAVHRVPDALGAIGTEAVIDPLLEMLNTLGKDKHGNVASNLVKCGFQALKDRLSPKQYEEILLLAHDYGGKSTEIQTALGEIGSPEIIKLLIRDLLRRPYSAPTVIEALVKIGKPTLQILCEKLPSSTGYTQREQTAYRKNILHVLEVAGDKTCVDMILLVAASDGSIEKEAKNAIEEIAKRDTSIKAPESIGIMPKKIKTAPSTGNDYVDSCFVFDYQEIDDSRDWYQIEEMRKLVDLANHDEPGKALSLLESVWEQYTDYYFVYIWKAILSNKLSGKDDARSIINEGLRKSKSKYLLCKKMGDIEYESGNLSKAVHWWIRCAASSISIGVDGDESAFMYLAYIAKFFNDIESSNRLFSKGDMIRSTRLNEDGQRKVRDMVSRTGGDSIRIAIRHLCENYL